MSAAETSHNVVSDSDDDKPIRHLVEKRKALMQQKKEQEKKMKIDEKNNSNKEREKDRSREKEKEKEREKKESKPKPVVVKQEKVVKDPNELKVKIAMAGGSKNKASEFYEETTKGMLVQKFLLRWWYVLEWPNMVEIGSPPTGFEQLDGFPGVFVSTTPGSLGKILDKRDMSKAPSLSNYAKKSCAELKDLCITAYERQIEQLINAEGEEDSRLVLSLKEELRKIRKLNVDNPEKDLEKEARKYYS